MANGPYRELYFMPKGVVNNENHLANNDGTIYEIIVNERKMLPCSEPEVQQTLWGLSVIMKVCDENGVWYLNRKYKKGKSPNSVGFSSGFSGNCSISDFFYNKSDLVDLHIKSSTLRTGTSVLFRRGEPCDCEIK